jgi:dCMP deaminase
VIYISDKYADSDATLASKRMLASAGVKLTRFASNKTITISFDEKEV